MMLDVKQEPIYILHTRAYRETSALIDAISLNQGRVSLIAQGVRGKRKTTLCILPNRPLLASFKGKNELLKLTSCEEQTTVPMLSGDALASAMYMNEITVRCLPKGMGSTEFFSAYALSLHGLLQGQSLSLHLRQFERALLEELQGQVALKQCISTGHKVVPEGVYSIEQGHVHEAKFGFRGQTLLDLTHNHLMQNHGGEMRTLLQQLLQPLLGDKPLQSKRLLKGKHK